MASANGPLFSELCSIDPSIPEILDAVIDEVHAYDSSLIKFWHDANFLERVAAYSLFYLTPFHELLRNKHPSETALLATQLMSCIAWRAYDNCVDGHQPPRMAHRFSLAACMQLTRYVESAFENKPADSIKNIELHYQLMADQAERELREPIPVEEIWKRCSLFLYAPDELARLDALPLSLFRDYINYTGLAHDLSDIMSDIATGVVSLPIHWIADAGDCGTINVQVLEQVYEHAQRAVRPLEEGFETADVESRYPLLHRLLRNASTVFDGR